MRMANISLAFRPYLERKILVIGLLGFSSGLPIMMTLSTLTYWLSRHGVGKEAIGLASLLGLPYAFKFLWAPFLDQYRPFVLGCLGRRKGWILLFQLLLSLVFIALSFINPSGHPVSTGVLIFFLAFFSASQDIVIDAYRIDYLTPEEQSYGSSSVQMTYRIGMLVMGAGVMSLSDFISWPFIFRLVAALFLLLFLSTFFIKEPQEELNTQEKDKAIPHLGGGSSAFTARIHKFFTNILEIFNLFFQKENALLILLFVICYKLPDAISGVMVADFYVDMNYSGTQIGTISKIYGLFATLLGAFVAGGVIRSVGIYRSLFYSAIAIGLTNLGYLLIFYFPTLSSLMIAITLENFISGFASALFIMFLSLLCDKEYSATQYALLTSFSVVGLRLLGGSAGYLVKYLGWVDFFILTAFLFLPTLFILWCIRKEVKPLTSNNLSSGEGRRIEGPTQDELNTL